MSNYVNGYWSKIDYWTHKLNQATVYDDLPAVKLALRKLNYFVERQEEVYYGDGEVMRRMMDHIEEIAGVDFSESLNQLNSLSIR